MQSRRGAVSVVSTYDQVYPEMVQSDNYTELFSGTKRECEEKQEQYEEDTANVLEE